MQRLSRRFSGNLFLYAVIGQVVFNIFYYVWAYFNLYALNANATLLVLFFRLLIYLPPVIIIAVRKYPVLHILRINTFKGRQIFFVTGISICIYLFVSLFGRMFESLPYSFIDPYMHLNYFSGMGFSLWPAIFTSCLVPAVLYELMFRGVVQSGFSDISPIKACLIVGILYGLMYSDITGFISYTVFGFVLSYISFKTGSIIPSMVTSFFYQLFKLINLKYLVYRYLLSSLGVGEDIIAFVLVMVSIIIGGVLLIKMPDTSKSVRPLRIPSASRTTQAFRDFRHKLQLSYFPDDTDQNNKENKIKEPVVNESFDAKLFETGTYPDDSPKQRRDTGFITGVVILAVIAIVSFGVSLYSVIQSFS